MPPITPEPSHNSQIWWIMTPKAEITRPPHQQSADTTPALRGPTRSSQPPMMAAAEPRNTKNRVYVHPSIEIFQSQLVAVICCMNPKSFGHATAWVMPTALDNGSQNTEKP